MKKYLAELVGTFVLTFLGCGTAVSLNCGSDTASVVGTAIAFGLSVVAMAYCIGGISGCHINPAITFGVLLSGRMTTKDAIGYWVGQFIGGVLAACCLAAIVGMEPSLALYLRDEIVLQELIYPTNYTQYNFTKLLLYQSLDLCSLVSIARSMLNLQRFSWMIRSITVINYVRQYIF